MNDNFYKQLIEKLPIGYAYHKIICDKQGNPCDYEFLEINDSFAKITRLKASEIVGKKISEILPEIKKDEFDWIKLYGEIAINGGEKEFEQYSQILKRWYRVKVYSPQEYYFITIFIDVTAEMRGVEEKTAILTTLNDIIFELDKDYRFNNIIASDDNYLFMPREKIIGRTIKELFSEELTKIFISSFEKAVVSGEKESIVYKSPLQDSEQWFKADIKHTEIGIEKGYIVSIINFTEQKKLEDNLLKKTQELEKFFSVNLDLLCIADTEGNFLNVNKEWENILGYSKEYIEKSNFMKFVHAEDVEVTIEAIRKLEKQEQVLNLVNRYRCKDGSYRYIEWRCQPYDNLIYAAARDITEKIEEQNLLKKMVSFSEEFLQLYEKELNYQKITDDFLHMSRAKFAAFNLYDEVGKQYKTMAISGDNDLIKKAIQLLGIKIEGNNWEYDLIRAEKIKDKIVTRFTSLKEFAGDFISKPLLDLLVNTFDIGEIIVIKILKNNTILGDFTFIMPNEKSFNNEIIAEMYTRQLGMVITQKRTENLLRIERERLENILKGTNVGTWEWDIEKGEIVFNERWAEIIGYKFNELSIINSKDLKRFFHAEDLRKCRIQLKKIFSKEIDYYDMELRMKHKDGSWIWVQDRGKITSWNSNGKPLLMSGTRSNINHRKQVENELMKSEEKYRLIFEYSPLGVYHFDSRGVITDCNDNFVKIIGSSREALIGLNTLKLSDEKLVEEIKRALHGYETTYEGNYKSFTGNKITSVRVMFATILSDDKSIEGGIGIVEDITERKRMEEIIFDEKERLKTTLLSIGDGVISTDSHGNILLLNRIAEKLTGWTQEEAVGKPLEEVFNLIDEFTREKCNNPVYNVLRTGNIVELCNNSILISKDGEERFIEDNAAPIKGENDVINGVALAFRDVSEKKERQEKIEYLSFYDQLTGLYNRRFFEEELKRLDTKSNLPITLVIIDVNGLKLTNDAFGHLEGDKLLQKVAKVIKKECRNEDIISRIGGDEFTIILPKTSSEETEKILNRINSAIDKEKFNSINVSISYGWKTKIEENEEMLAVFKKAEDYMYRRKLSESTSMRYKTIEVIIKTLYEKNEREEKHSIRVGELCALIASTLNLSDANIRELRTAGLMHDIGKIAIDGKILNKPSSLSDSEWLEIKRHPEIGYRILSSLNEYAPIAEYALAHHERWDGKGYPKGLKGEEIPWQARVIAVADAYDAMTRDRPYRKNLSKSDAIEIIRKNAGTQFDPEIVKLFIEKALNEE
ncbi:PAS domain S-box protein [Clostridium sp. MB05]